MARRRSLNRRWSRKSSGGTGILNDDSNIMDQDDDVWWKRLENQTNSIRPSGRISIGEYSANTELSSGSTINDSGSTSEWWETLQKTSQDLISNKSTNKSKESPPKESVISSTSNSETEERLRETKKQRVHLRRMRKSVGKNAFSLVLESSEAEIESQLVSSKNTQSLLISDQSSGKSPLEKFRQKNKNNIVESDDSVNSDTNKIRKTRTTIFKKPRTRISHNVFNDVLENDETIESLSPSIEKPGHESDIDSEQINDKSPLTQNKSLNESKKSVTKSLNQKSRNQSEQILNDKTGSIVFANLSNLENQHLASQSNSEPEEIDAQQKKRSRRISRRDSDNVSVGIINANDIENSEVSSQEKSSRNWYSRTAELNNTSTNNRNVTSDNKIRPETTANKAHESSIKRLETYDSDESETMSISEVLKTGNSNQQNVSNNIKRFSKSNKMNYSSHSYNSEGINQIKKDWDSDGSKKPDDSRKKLNQNVSEGNKSTEVNNENEKPKRVSQRLQSRSRHDVEGDSRNENSLQNHSKSSVENDVNMSVESQNNSNKIRQSPENIPINESKTSDEDISITKPNKKRSTAAEIVMESDSSEEKIIIKKHRRKRVSAENTGDEAKAKDAENFSMKSAADHLVFNEPETEKSESNNNTGLDVFQTSPIAKRQSQRTSKNNSTTSERSLKENSKIEEKIAESDVSDSENESSRDPSAYVLPDMNRSDSIILSDSDNENGFDHSSSSLKKNPNSTVHSSLRENLRSEEKKNEKSKITSYLTPKQSAKSSPRTIRVPNESSAQKSLTNPSGHKLMKIDLSNRNYIRDSLLAQNSSYDQPIQHEPLPTEEDVHDFREKLKIAAMKLDQNIRPYKEQFEKQLDERQTKSLKQKNSGINKIMPLRNKNSKAPKVVDRAYIVNDKVYKQPKLPRPKRWATDRLYKYLWKKLEPKCKLETRVRSEKFVIDLAAVVTIVTRRKKYDNYKDEVDGLMKKMARLGIIETRNDFYHFCYEFLPYEFRSKVTPILQPGNKTTIPYDPDIVDVPLLNK